MKLTTILALSLLLGSCGGKDGSDGDSTTINIPAPPQNEEEEPAGCLTTARRANIQTFLNRVSSLETIVAPTIYTVRNPDGSYTSFNSTLIFDMYRESENNWQLSTQLCDADVANCFDPKQTRLAILEDNCFYSDSTKAKITYSTSSKLNFNFAPTQSVRIYDTLGLSSQKLYGTETDTLDGKVQNKATFQQ